MKTKHVAILPARSGSSRIPLKNIREFVGIPIIGRVINTLKESNIFDRIIVSTDSEDVMEVAKLFGAEIPFVRPKYISDNKTGTSSVIKHALRELEITNESHGINVCCVYPTAALMTISDLLVAKRFVEQIKWRYIFAATKINETSALRAFIKNKNGALSMLAPQYQEYNSQDLPHLYTDCGFFYWATINNWLSYETTFDSFSNFVEIPEMRGVDINTEQDWHLAEKSFLEYTSSL